MGYHMLRRNKVASQAQLGFVGRLAEAETADVCGDRLADAFIPQDKIDAGFMRPSVIEAAPEAHPGSVAEDIEDETDHPAAGETGHEPVVDTAVAGNRRKVIRGQMV